MDDTPTQRGPRKTALTLLTQSNVQQRGCQQARHGLLLTALPLGPSAVNVRPNTSLAPISEAMMDLLDFGLKPLSAFLSD